MLKKIGVFLGFLGGFAVRNGLDYKRNIIDYEEKIVSIDTRARRNAAILDVYSKWLSIKQEGKTLEKYFEDNGYHTIAIYGLSKLGLSLIKELEGTKVKIDYAIDKRSESIFEAIECVNPSQKLKEVDAVVVTPIFSYSEIEELLEDKLSCPIISLDDIVDYMK